MPMEYDEYNPSIDDYEGLEELLSSVLPDEIFDDVADVLLPWLKKREKDKEAPIYTGKRFTTRTAPNTGGTRGWTRATSLANAEARYRVVVENNHGTTISDLTFLTISGLSSGLKFGNDLARRSGGKATAYSRAGGGSWIERGT